MLCTCPTQCVDVDFKRTRPGLSVCCFLPMALMCTNVQLMLAHADNSQASVLSLMLPCTCPLAPSSAWTLTSNAHGRSPSTTRQLTWQAFSAWTDLIFPPSVLCCTHAEPLFPAHSASTSIQALFSRCTKAAPLLPSPMPCTHSAWTLTSSAHGRSPSSMST